MTTTKKKITKKKTAKPKSKTKAKTTKKKYVPTEKAKSKSYSQVGLSDTLSDAKRKKRAKKAGWRKSASGNWYFERRRNRSDKQSGAKI